MIIIVARSKRSSRDLAEAIAAKILTHIQKKLDRFLKASQNNDLESMFLNQLTEAEEHFIQQQQKLDQDADHIDAQSGFLADMAPGDLDALFEKLSRYNDASIDLPPMPDLTEEANDNG